MNNSKRVILSEEEFVCCMNEIQKFHTRVDNINEAIKENCEDGIYFPPSLEHVVNDLLKAIFNDKYDTIEYFMYELDFGKKWKRGMFTIYEVDVKLQNAEDLYEYLLTE
jgi:hypothetical protein